MIPHHLPVVRMADIVRKYSIIIHIAKLCRQCHYASLDDEAYTVDNTTFTIANIETILYLSALLSTMGERECTTCDYQSPPVAHHPVQVCNNGNQALPCVDGRDLVG